MSDLINQIGRLNEILKSSKLGDGRQEADAILAQMLREANEDKRKCCPECLGEGAAWGSKCSFCDGSGFIKDGA